MSDDDAEALPIGDWGVDEQPSTPTGEGWFKEHEAAVYVFLPALWSASHRCWVPFERDWKWTSTSEPPKFPPVPWTDEEYEEWEGGVNQQLKEVGVVFPRSAGRTWYLRLPEGFSDLEEFLDQLTVDLRESGTGMGDPGSARVVARQLGRYTWADVEDGDD